MFLHSLRTSVYALTALVSISAAQSAFAYPGTPVHNAQADAIAEIDAVVNTLDLKNGRDINIAFSLSTGAAAFLSACFMGQDIKALPLFIVFTLVCIYNSVEASTKNSAINHAEKAKQIIRDHFAYLNGYIRY